MNRLLKIGFQCVGRWKMVDGNLEFELTSHAYSENVLYAFVCNGNVKYIGKTVKTIYQRLYGYKKPSISQRTNFRVNKELQQLLKKGFEVDIYIFTDNAELKFRDIKINLAAGLEDTLISELMPEWNFTGKNSLKKSKKKMEKVNAKDIDNSDYIIINIGKAYYNDGFFNIRKEYSGLFGEHLTKIRIQLGEDPNHFCYGKVNRTANLNKSPRIMGGVPYKRWIQENFKQGDIFKVKVINHEFIKLIK